MLVRVWKMGFEVKISRIFLDLLSPKPTKPILTSPEMVTEHFVLLTLYTLIFAKTSILQLNLMVPFTGQKGTNPFEDWDKQWESRRRCLEKFALGRFQGKV